MTTVDQSPTGNPKGRPQQVLEVALGSAAALALGAGVAIPFIENTVYLALDLAEAVDLKDAPAAVRWGIVIPALYGVFRGGGEIGYRVGGWAYDKGAALPEHVRQKVHNAFTAFQAAGGAMAGNSGASSEIRATALPFGIAVAIAESINKLTNGKGLVNFLRKTRQIHATQNPDAPDGKTWIVRHITDKGIGEPVALTEDEFLKRKAQIDRSSIPLRMETVEGDRYVTTRTVAGQPDSRGFPIDGPSREEVGRDGQVSSREFSIEGKPASPAELSVRSASGPHVTLHDDDVTGMSALKGRAPDLYAIAKGAGSIAFFGTDDHLVISIGVDGGQMTAIGQVAPDTALLWRKLLADHTQMKVFHQDTAHRGHALVWAAPGSEVDPMEFLREGGQTISFQQDTYGQVDLWQRGFTHSITIVDAAGNREGMALTSEQVEAFKQAYDEAGIAYSDGDAPGQKMGR